VETIHLKVVVGVRAGSEAPPGGRSGGASCRTVCTSPSLPILAVGKRVAVRQWRVRLQAMRPREPSLLLVMGER